MASPVFCLILYNNWLKTLNGLHPGVNVAPHGAICVFIYRRTIKMDPCVVRDSYLLKLRSYTHRNNVMLSLCTSLVLYRVSGFGPSLFSLAHPDDIAVKK